MGRGHRYPVGDPFTGHTGWVRSVALGQVEGRVVVVSGGDDGTVRVWDAATGAPVGDPFTGHADSVNAVAFGQVEGRAVVVSGSTDHTVRVWYAATGTPISEHPCQDQRSLALPSTIDLSAAVYGLITAPTPTSRLIAATELGIVSLRLPH